MNDLELDLLDAQLEDYLYQIEEPLYIEVLIGVHNTLFLSYN